MHISVFSASVKLLDMFVKTQSKKPAYYTSIDFNRTHTHAPKKTLPKPLTIN